MRLIIAEKHSVARAIAQAIGGGAEQNGHIRCKDCIITWAQGHLVDLMPPDEYQDGRWKSWNLESLPIDPHPGWRWKVSQAHGAARQYRIIDGLIRSGECDTIVNACDPDREGEAIFRRIITHAHANHPVMRLWAPSLEGHAIRHALDSMQPANAYQGLADAADLRAKADWLIGMNATRAYSVLAGVHMSVGRVQTPTLWMVVDRDDRITRHVSEPYWTVHIPMSGWTLTSPRHTNKGDAETLASLFADSGTPVSITEVERMQRHERPPHLYDLTTLQRDMNSRYGIPASRTLNALQHLYESKLATYPRTDSRYITEADLDTLHRLMDGNWQVDGFINPEARPENPRTQLVVDDSKVTGHTAILPTENVNADILGALNEDERLVLTSIVARMWESVAEDAIHHVIRVTAHPQGHDDIPLTTTMDTITAQGWKAIGQQRQKNGEQGEHNPIDNDSRMDMTGERIPDTVIPGAVIASAGAAEIREDSTKPPKPFTEASLLSAMEHASRYLEDKDLKAALDDDTSHSGGIGTPATRAGIIEQLIGNGYLERSGKTITSTSKGKILIDMVAPMHRDPATTARMEQALNQGERGQLDPKQVLEQFRLESTCIPRQAQDIFRSDPDIARRLHATEEYGGCPKCSNPVIKRGKTWQCSTNRRSRDDSGTWTNTAGCGWTLWPVIAGRNLTDANVRSLLSEERIRLTGFRSKTGKKFSADLVIDPERGAVLDLDRRRR